ncbi:MAG: iron ABC transporter permease [Planctomycetota bacterium]
MAKLIRPWPLACLMICGLVALPTVTVLSSLFQPFGEEWNHLAETRLTDYIRNTAILGVAVCFFAALIGTAAAYLVGNHDFPGRGFFSWALILPLAVPGYIAAYAYTDLLEFSGPLQTWLRGTFGWGRRDYWFPQVRSLPGAVAILTFTLYPYVYLAARAAFVEQSRCVLEVGRTLDCGPWRSFFRIALPLARPSIVAGTLLVMMETLADFGAVDYFAVDTFATGIYRTWRGLESPTTAAQLATVLLSVVSLVLLVELLARRRARYHQLSSGRAAVSRTKLGIVGSAAAIVVCGLPVLVGFIGPAAIFIFMAIDTGDGRAVEVVREYGSNTLVLSAIAAAIAVALSLIVVYSQRLVRTRTTLIAGKFAGLGYALPGPVIAIGLLAPLSWADHKLNGLLTAGFDLQVGLVFTGSVFAVVMGYQTRFLAVALSMLETSFGRIKPSLDDAARTLGASNTGLMTRIHLPLLRASVFAAFLLVFVDVAKELPATLMLRPFNFDTLAVRVYQLASDERLEEAAFGALVIIGVGLIPVLVLSLLLDRHGRKAPAPPTDEVARV